MDFLLSDIHSDLASTVDAILSKADMPTIIRAYATDPTTLSPVLRQLAEAGICGLIIDDEHGGSGAGVTELVVAAEQLGRHGMPGPVVESLAVAPKLLADAGLHQRLAPIAEGTPASCAIEYWQPNAADARSAAQVYLLASGTLSVARIASTTSSVDPGRTVSTVAVDTVLVEDVDSSPAAVSAADLGALTTAAYLLGLGQTMLTLAAEYAKSRNQFGRAIGSFQAVKHHLADVAIALEMARPLVHAAALGADGLVPANTNVLADISAAKVTASDAAYLAARQALQVLGAIGYTAEHDLSLYLTKTRALVGAWGTPAQHRQRILGSL